MDFQKSNALVNKLDERRENQFLNFFLISCLSYKDLSTTRGESMKKKSQAKPLVGSFLCSCGKHIKIIDECKLRETPNV